MKGTYIKLEEKKNILNRQYTTVVVHYLNHKGQPQEYVLVDHKGPLHYGKLGVDSWHHEYSNYDNLIYDLEKRYLPKEVSDRLYVKKGLFSKKKFVYESCRCGDERINRKSFIKLIFNQEYKEAKDLNLQTVVQWLPVEELFLFARDHCDDLKCYETLNEYIKKEIEEKNNEITRLTDSLLKSILDESFNNCRM